jgi:hypothetical protein
MRGEQPRREGMHRSRTMQTAADIFLSSLSPFAAHLPSPPAPLPAYAERGEPNQLRVCVATLMVMLSSIWASSLHAAELHSNGLGGGDWSDPLSWREKTVPTPDDDVVISRGDIIAFDRDDEGKTSCKQLFIDPKGSFTFKTGIGRAVCVVAGQIESYGAVLIDASKSSSDKFELRLTGATAPERTIKLLKGAKFAVHGRRSLAHGKHNAVVTGSHDAASKAAAVEVLVEAKDGASLDLQRGEFLHVHVAAYDIDNTGAEVDERLNIVGNHFAGQSHLSLTNCDSPLLADNLFELTDVPPFAGSAMYLIVCQLAEIRGNTVRGRYGLGIQARQMVDSVLSDCEVEGCSTGIYWYGTNGMVKDCVARKCDTGVTFTSMSGTGENIRCEGCKTGYYHAVATAQLTNLQIVDVPKDGVVVSYQSGPLRLLNCNLTPEQIVPTAAASAKVRDGIATIEWLYYLVVRPKGNVPTGSRIEVRTANAAEPKTAKAARAADPFVRNSPAPLRFDGLTPLPDSLEPIIVRGWTFDDDVKPVPPPSYQISVIPPAPTSGDAPKPVVLKTVTPDATWYRADANKPEPTVEVNAP